MLRMFKYLLAAVCCVIWVWPAAAGPWIAADWAGNEPAYPPGSLFYHTNQYPTCPVVYRTVVTVQDKDVAYAAVRIVPSQYAFVFLNGRQIGGTERAGGGGARGGAAAAEAPRARTLDVELTPHLRSGRNVLVVSTRGEGFSMDGAIAYQDGTMQRIESAVMGWRVHKLAPLTILEDQPFMQPQFDDSSWFAVRAADGQATQMSADELRQIAQRLENQRLTQADVEAAWRLSMLSTKGFAVVDWESFGFGGAGRLPAWLLQIARRPASGVGNAHLQAEALTRWAVLNDAADNLANHAVGLAALNAAATDVAACRTASEQMRPMLAAMREAIERSDWQQAIRLAARAQSIADGAHRGRVLNRLNFAMDNKFSWCDTNALLGSGTSMRDLTIARSSAAYSSPLSPATLVTADAGTIVLRGWSTPFENNRFDSRNRPPTAAPQAFWAVIGGQLAGMKPVEDGAVYDVSTNGRLSENWMSINADISRGGDLPVQMVFLQQPSRVSMRQGAKDVEITISFERPDAQMFVLRPLKEWRGLLQMARDLVVTDFSGQAGRGSRRYVEDMRLFSRSLLNYPVSYTESFVRDPQDKWALLVCDVYNYLELSDEWNTQPLKLAPLPVLACYGLMTNYPGLKVLSQARTVGSWGEWGDHIAVEGQGHIVYRVPMDPIRRFGGFTAYAFGPTDIGEPGSRTEIELIKATGANSFRPQHNQTGERAMRTAQWCVEMGIQNVFNTDEKWVPDVVEFYRTLARQCRDFPPDTIAYDLLNEPQTRDPRPYSALMKKITNAIREYDKTHLIYVEVMPPWGPGAQPFPRGAFETLEPTGDPLTVYSFHDYEYRLGRIEGGPRQSTETGRAFWPNEKADCRDLYTRYIPALRYSIDHRAPIHLGEFGGFEQVRGQDVYTNQCALTMMMDYINLFNQYGWHWHYYANRGTTRVRADGSVQESYVHAAVRRDFGRGLFNINRMN